jgi:hypothetical protein
VGQKGVRRSRDGGIRSEEEYGREKSKGSGAERGLEEQKRREEGKRKRLSKDVSFFYTLLFSQCVQRKK